MATFIMYGKYSIDAVKNMSAKRTNKSIKLMKNFGGKVKSMYATLGANDLVFVVDFPDNDSATKASVALCKSTGISFTTSPAMPVEKFDKILDEL